MLTQGTNNTQFSLENIQLCCNGDFQQQQASTTSFSAQDVSLYMPINLFSNGEIPNGFMFSPQEVSGQTKSIVDLASILLNPSMIENVE